MGKAYSKHLAHKRRADGDGNNTEQSTQSKQSRAQRKEEAKRRKRQRKEALIRQKYTEQKQAEAEQRLRAQRERARELQSERIQTRPRIDTRLREQPPMAMGSKGPRTVQHGQSGMNLADMGFGADDLEMDVRAAAEEEQEEQEVGMGVTEDAQRDSVLSEQIVEEAQIVEVGSDLISPRHSLDLSEEAKQSVPIATNTEEEENEEEKQTEIETAEAEEETETEMDADDVDADDDVDAYDAMRAMSHRKQQQSLLSDLEIGTITEEASTVTQHTPLSRVPSQFEVDAPEPAVVGKHRTHISRSRMLRPSNLNGMDDDDDADVDITPMMLAAKLKEKRPTTDGRGHRYIASYDSALGQMDAHAMEDLVPSLDRERSVSYMPFDGQRERTASYGSDLGHLAYDEFMVSEIEQWPLEGTTPRSNDNPRFSTLSNTGLTMIVSKSKRPSEPPTPRRSDVMHGVELSEENVGDSIW